MSWGSFSSSTSFDVDRQLACHQQFTMTCGYFWEIQIKVTQNLQGYSTQVYYCGYSKLNNCCTPSVVQNQIQGFPFQRSYLGCLSIQFLKVSLTKLWSRIASHDRASSSGVRIFLSCRCRWSICRNRPFLIWDPKQNSCKTMQTNMYKYFQIYDVNVHSTCTVTLPNTLIRSTPYTCVLSSIIWLVTGVGCSSTGLNGCSAVTGVGSAWHCHWSTIFSDSSSQLGWIPIFRTCFGSAGGGMTTTCGWWYEFGFLHPFNNSEKHSQASWLLCRLPVLPLFVRHLLVTFTLRKPCPFISIYFTSFHPLVG